MIEAETKYIMKDLGENAELLEDQIKYVVSSKVSNLENVVGNTIQSKRAKVGIEKYSVEQINLIKKKFKKLNFEPTPTEMTKIIDNLDAKKIRNMNFTEQMEDLFKGRFNIKDGKIVDGQITDKNIEEIFKSPFTNNGSNLVESRISDFMDLDTEFARSVNEYKIKEILETPEKSTKKYIQKKERYNNVLKEQKTSKIFIIKILKN